MTTVCALLGGVPLMLGTGTGSEIRQPLGYTVVGGLLVSQLLTLFTTPVVYIYMDRARQYLGGGSRAVLANADAAPEGKSRPDIGSTPHDAVTQPVLRTRPTTAQRDLTTAPRSGNR
jgi:hypothetical protein